MPGRRVRLSWSRLRLGARLWLWDVRVHGLGNFSLYVFAVFVFLQTEKRFMNRVKWILLGYVSGC